MATCYYDRWFFLCPLFHSFHSCFHRFHTPEVALIIELPLPQENNKKQ